jgi:hypothetical protein
MRPAPSAGLLPFGSFWIEDMVLRTQGRLALMALFARREGEDATRILGM